jgi:hypothetical protein
MDHSTAGESFLTLLTQRIATPPSTACTATTMPTDTCCDHSKRGVDRGVQRVERAPRGTSRSNTWVLRLPFVLQAFVDRCTRPPTTGTLCMYATSTATASCRYSDARETAVLKASCVRATRVRVVICVGADGGPQLRPRGALPLAATRRRASAAGHVLATKPLLRRRHAASHVGTRTGLHTCRGWGFQVRVIDDMFSPSCGDPRKGGGPKVMTALSVYHLWLPRALLAATCTRIDK